MWLLAITYSILMEHQTLRTIPYCFSRYLCRVSILVSKLRYALTVVLRTGPTPEKADASKQETELQGRAKRDEWTDEWGLLSGASIWLTWWAQNAACKRIDGYHNTTRRESDVVVSDSYAIKGFVRYTNIGKNAREGGKKVTFFQLGVYQAFR